jgi:hypothetical protein
MGREPVSRALEVNYKLPTGSYVGDSGYMDIDIFQGGYKAGNSES